MQSILTTFFRLVQGLVLLVMSLIAVTAWADGLVVDKIYHPYVEPLAQELEWRSVIQDNQPGADDDKQIYRFAYGRAIGERWMGEVYLIGEKSSGSNFEVEAYEVEALWQLTEQGEYWADWGVLFELERERGEDVWEFGSGVLIEKEFSDWSVTGNLLFIYEWGDDINDELESSTAVQVRYRYSRQFEPAIEVYFGENTHALGPVMLGQINLGIRKTLNWETGVLFGLDSSSPNRSVRMLLEFEF